MVKKNKKKNHGKKNAGGGSIMVCAKSWQVVGITVAVILLLLGGVCGILYYVMFKKGRAGNTVPGEPGESVIVADVSQYDDDDDDDEESRREDDESGDDDDDDEGSSHNVVREGDEEMGYSRYGGEQDVGEEEDTPNSPVYSSPNRHTQSPEMTYKIMKDLVKKGRSSGLSDAEAQHVAKQSVSQVFSEMSVPAESLFA